MSEMNLIVNITANPPVISIFGPVKESTIDRLNEVIPTSCSTTYTGKIPFSFVHKDEPPHWYAEVKNQFLSEDIGSSQLFIALLDALEEEGAWKLRGCTNVPHDGDKNTYRFFFVKGAH
eukprot:gene1857-1136_t